MHMVGQSMPHKGALMAYWEAAGSLLQPKTCPNAQVGAQRRRLTRDPTRAKLIPHIMRKRASGPQTQAHMKDTQGGCRDAHSDAYTSHT